MDQLACPVHVTLPDGVLECRSDCYGMFQLDRECVNACPATHRYLRKNVCTRECSGYVLPDPLYNSGLYQCVDACHGALVPSDDANIPQLKCVQQCDVGKRVGPDGLCV